MTSETVSPVFEWPVRVYWEDTDAGGVVYYANYLRFLERSRSEWVRALGVDQSKMAEETGAALIVRTANCDFIKSARLDDELRVTCEPVKVGAASMVLNQRVLRVADGELLMKAEIKAGCVDTERWVPRRFPPRLAEAVKKVMPEK
jgi:acyl-CoA thioester hydrolase